MVGVALIERHDTSCLLEGRQRERRREKEGGVKGKRERDSRSREKDKNITILCTFVIVILTTMPSRKNLTFVIKMFHVYHISTRERVLRT